MHRVPVPAVPDRQPVEADDPLEERQPREQEDLDQRQVAGEERRDAAEPEQDVVEACASGSRSRPRRPWPET